MKINTQKRVYFLSIILSIIDTPKKCHFGKTNFLTHTHTQKLNLDMRPRLKTQAKYTQKIRLSYLEITYIFGGFLSFFNYKSCLKKN